MRLSISAIAYLLWECNSCCYPQVERNIWKCNSRQSPRQPNRGELSWRTSEYSPEGTRCLSICSADFSPLLLHFGFCCCSHPWAPSSNSRRITSYWYWLALLTGGRLLGRDSACCYTCGTFQQCVLCTDIFSQYYNSYVNTHKFL